MTDLRQAAQAALEALESGDWYIGQLENIVYDADDTGTHEERAKVQAAIIALRAALERPAPELPPLPNGMPLHGSYKEWYTADQMREYGRKCAAAALLRELGGAL